MTTALPALAGAPSGAAGSAGSPLEVAALSLRLAGAAGYNMGDQSAIIAFQTNRADLAVAAEQRVAAGARRLEQEAESHDHQVWQRAKHWVKEEATQLHASLADHHKSFVRRSRSSNDEGRRPTWTK